MPHRTLVVMLLHRSWALGTGRQATTSPLGSDAAAIRVVAMALHGRLIAGSPPWGLGSRTPVYVTRVQVRSPEAAASEGVVTVSLDLDSVDGSSGKVPGRSTVTDVTRVIVLLAVAGDAHTVVLVTPIALTPVDVLGCPGLVALEGAVRCELAGSAPLKVSA